MLRGIGSTVLYVKTSRIRFWILVGVYDGFLWFDGPKRFL